MRQFFLFSLLIFLWSAAPMAGAGSISGTVRYDGPAYPMQPINMEADAVCAAIHADDPARDEALVLGEGQTLGNVLVRVVAGPALEAEYTAPTAPVTLDQHGCRYSPRVFVLQPGQPLRILNPDGTTHNVNILSTVNPGGNIGMRADKTEAFTTFEKAEDVFPIKCDVHPWMRAYCAVLPHPFHAVTGPDGVFAIDGLAPGDYELEAWHERLGTQRVKVTVAAEGTADAAFVLSRGRSRGSNS